MRPGALRRIVAVSVPAECFGERPHADYLACEFRQDDFAAVVFASSGRLEGEFRQCHRDSAWQFPAVRGAALHRIHDRQSAAIAKGGSGARFPRGNGEHARSGAGSPVPRLRRQRRARYANKSRRNRAAANNGKIRADRPRFNRTGVRAVQ